MVISTDERADSLAEKSTKPSLSKQQLFVFWPAAYYCDHTEYISIGYNLMTFQNWFTSQKILKLTFYINDADADAASAADDADDEYECAEYKW